MKHTLTTKRLKYGRPVLLLTMYYTIYFTGPIKCPHDITAATRNRFLHYKIGIWVTEDENHPVCQMLLLNPVQSQTCNLCLKNNRIPLPFTECFLGLCVRRKSWCPEMETLQILVCVFLGCFCTVNGDEIIR